jgi:L-ascorbate metabolism protein UlaG (beta-lactamase superfamily)
MLAFILFPLLFVVLLLLTVGFFISAPRYKGPVSNHFNGKVFTNFGGTRAKGGKELLKWMLSRKQKKWITRIENVKTMHPLAHFKDGIRITFINHSTFLIQVDGLNILTDPIWSKRASPFRWLGPKRVCLPGIKLEDLPTIHVVLLSHNHYDHLDLPTMRVLFGAHHPRIITPLGVKAFLDKERIIGAIDMDWWSSIDLNHKVSIVSVPAQHFSGRGMFDRDATLWCGYVLKTSSGNIYVAGDTGYNTTIFQMIKEKCSPIRVSLLPIGAYKPEWFMSAIHVSPEEAVKIHLDIQSPVSIATHFGTFPLADDGYDDPINDLKIALQRNDLSAEDFIIMKEGEVSVFE